MAPKQDISISFMKANLLSLLTPLPIIVFLAFLYALVWGGDRYLIGLYGIFSQWVVLIALLILGGLLHELILGIVWAAAGKISYKKVQFGFHVKSMTPYAHCTAPISMHAYRLGSVMPLILMGLLPSFIGILLGMSIILGFGSLFILLAGGDLLLLWLVRHIPHHYMVEDHPARVGCLVYPSEAQD